LQHAKLIPLPNTQPLSLEPGTFYAATLGYGGETLGIGVYPHEAQSIEECNVLVGERYAIVARDGEWCVIEKNGFRGSVPSLCIAEYDDSLLKQQGTCLYDYRRKSGKEISIKRGTLVTILGMYQHWSKIQDGYNEGLVPSNHIILSSCDHYHDIVTRYVPAVSPIVIHEKFKHGLRYLDFWENNIGKGTGIDSSVRKLATNTRKLARDLFSKESASIKMMFEGPLCDEIEGKIKEFCLINAAKQEQYNSLQERSEKFDLVRSVIRKNYALLMKLANILLQNPNIATF
jgi:hypothetical protein